MKNFQQTLFIVIALALCGLCAHQWYFQTVQRTALERLNQQLYQKSSDIQGYTNSIKTMDAEVAQLQSRVADLKQAATTNDEFILNEKNEAARLQSSSEIMSNQIVDYKAAVATLEGKLKEAYDGIKKQNAALTDLVKQRDEFVQKFNASVKERNDLVTKYNDVVDRINKLQAAPKNGGR